MARGKLTSFVSAVVLAWVCAAPSVARELSVRQLYVFSCNGGVCPNGESPAALLLSADGNFYGVTGNGGTGTGAVGTVFRLTPDFQSLTTLYTFQPDQNGKHPNGAWPTGLVEGDDGNLYGTTIAGGTNDGGVIFRVSKTGDFTLLHSLCPTCGEGADAEFLVKGKDGNFYGDAYGVLFRITPNGAFKVLHTFDSNTEGPDALGLALGSNGNFYGTSVGGLGLLTSLFRLKPSGDFGVLQTFHYSDFPTSAPVMAADGHLYGVLSHDADDDGPGLFRSNLSSSKFKVPALQIDAHDLTVSLHLMQDSGGTLWGAINSANDYPDGALFGWSTKGRALHEIVLDGANGANPAAPLIETGDGTLVGIATTGGTAESGDTAAGTVFAVQ